MPLSVRTQELDLELFENRTTHQRLAFSYASQKVLKSPVFSQESLSIYWVVFFLTVPPLKVISVSDYIVVLSARIT